MRKTKCANRGLNAKWPKLEDDILNRFKSGISNAIDASEDHLIYEEENDDNKEEDEEEEEEEEEEESSDDYFQGF